MLIGEAIRNHDLWTAEGMAYDKRILKVKEFARNKKLDGEAKSGKQAVDTGRVQDWSDSVDGQEGGDRNTLHGSGVLDFLCATNGYRSHSMMA